MGTTHNTKPNEFVKAVKSSIVYTVATVIEKAAEGLLNDDGVDRKACEKLARRILKVLGLN